MDGPPGKNILGLTSLLCNACYYRLDKSLADPSQTTRRTQKHRAFVLVVSDSWTSLLNYELTRYPHRRFHVSHKYLY